MLKELEVVWEMKTKRKFICHRRKISMARIFFQKSTNWDLTKIKLTLLINHRDNLSLREQPTFYNQDIIRITDTKNKEKALIIMIFLLQWFHPKIMFVISQMTDMEKAWTKHLIIQVDTWIVNLYLKIIRRIIMEAEVQIQEMFLSRNSLITMITNITKDRI